MNILFIGDIVGKIGRKAVIKILPKLKKEKEIDLVIANGENSAHGAGVTEGIIQELTGAGIDILTTGDHAFNNKKHLEVFNNYPIIRPANFPPGAPGRGFTAVSAGNKEIIIINLIGRVFMKADYDCPFRKLDEILANINLLGKKISAIILDIHAETTSEKVNIGHYADGRVSAVIGTHTHIMTADQKITSRGTAYITDAGMVGASDESLGIAKEGTLKTFLTQIKERHVLPEKGRVIFSSILMNINSKTAKAGQIKTITKFINIK